MFECDNVPFEEAEICNEEFKKQGIVGVQKYVSKRLNQWRHIPLNIAVTGKSGAGKSTFINAIRGLKVGDEGAAFTDVKEGTKTIKSYNHPNNKNIVFWDLPGVGTDSFKREEYELKVKLEKYDFFLIFSSERFLENDGWLAKQIKMMGKRFYFVRTKVFIDISNESKSRATPRPREEILDTVLNDCLQSLENYGISDSPVYLIDNFETDDFDFSRLQAKLIEDAPQMKREAIAFSIMGRTKEIMFQKMRQLEGRIPMISLASALGGAIPIPGVSALFDVTLMQKEIRFYREQLGFTDESIKRIAELSGMREEDLIRELDLKDLLVKCTKNGLMTLSRAYVMLRASKGVSNLVLPLIGTAIEGIMSYKTTSYCLKKILHEMYEDSLNLCNKCVKITEINAKL